MKGDFSRIRFNPKKQYTAVLDQQGRVSLDADANEQRFIDGYLQSVENSDTIGEYGAPINDAGFAITASGTQLVIGPGRYYVEGLMCENLTSNLGYNQQPYLVNPNPVDSALLSQLSSHSGGAIQVRLEVWQRLVTALDDGCLREPALGQADTTARLETVWRVVADFVAVAPPAPSDCCAQMYQQPRLRSTATMAAQTSGGGSDSSCQPVAAAGYQGLENQLYRVEIHQGGQASAATFKWSRENASVLASIQRISGPTLYVNSTGPDANLGFQSGDWVEIYDDTNLFGQTPNTPGTLRQVLSVDSSGPSITLSAPPATSVDTTKNARVRRWDQSSGGPTGIPIAAGTWLTLENGIQVQFGAGSFLPGDYWLIVARTASGKIDWPPCGSSGNLFQPAGEVTVYSAPLACIHWDTTNQKAVVEDCRRIFSPLTSLTPCTPPSALHITGYSWRNDDLTTFDELISSGLTVTLDGAPTSPINGANFIVTVETVNTAIVTEFLRVSTSFNATSAAPVAPVAAAAETSVAPAATVAAAVETPAAPAATVAAAVETPAAPAASVAAAAETSVAPAASVAAAAETSVAPAASVAAAAAASAQSVSPPSVTEIASTSLADKIKYSGPILLKNFNFTDYTTVFQVLPLFSSILDWQVDADASSTKIAWTLPSTDQTGLQSVYLLYINAMLGLLIGYGIIPRLRIRLLGSTIFAQNGTTQTFLDGQSFATSATRLGTTTPCLALTMPSGAGVRASDFEGWLYLAPFNGVTSISINYNALTPDVNIVGVVTGAKAGAPPAPVTVIVTVNLAYVAVMSAGVTVNLALSAVTAGTSASSFVSLSTTSLVIPQGSSSGTANVRVFGNPGLNVTDTFQISASVQLAMGPGEWQTVNFTLAGVAVGIVVRPEV
jgi:hypothetical protein